MFPIKQEKNKRRKEKKPNRGLKVAAILLSIALFGELVYCFFAFSDIPKIKALREMFIDTAFETNSHQWLATMFLPKYMTDYQQEYYKARKIAQDHFKSDQSDRNIPTTTLPPATVDPSSANDPTEPNTEPNTEPSETTPTATAEDRFYELFWELSRTSFEDYLDTHPETLDNGWENIYINEAGLSDSGTDIYTSMGEQVLAIDAKNKILLVRVKGTGYQGVLAIGKDPSQLRCGASEGIGSYGQSMEKLVTVHGGVLGMSASGFYDPQGAGTGGIIAGYAMCEGKEYGYHYQEKGYKRIEFTNQNRFYIVNTYDEMKSDVTDAVEFSPALIVDGELAVGGFYDWNGINPRACIGQSSRGEILMLVVEGRLTSRSIGTDVETCAKILMRHDGYTAMNLDGGASAIMWFDGEYVTKCSNGGTSRNLPNAWIYGNYDG